MWHSSAQATLRIHGRQRAAETNQINIWVCMDFSGSTAQEGLQEFPCFEMMVKEKNAGGGVNSRQIKLLVLDNSGDPTKTVGTLKVLKEINKVPIIYYGINSVGGIAAKAWADQNKVPIITAAPVSDKLVQEQGKTWGIPGRVYQQRNGQGYPHGGKENGRQEDRSPDYHPGLRHRPGDGGQKILPRVRPGATRELPGVSRTART